MTCLLNNNVQKTLSDEKTWLCNLCTFATRMIKVLFSYFTHQSLLSSLVCVCVCHPGCHDITHFSQVFHQHKMTVSNEKQRKTCRKKEMENNIIKCRENNYQRISPV